MKKVFKNDRFFQMVTFLGCFFLLVGGILGIIIYPEFRSLSIQCIVMALAMVSMVFSYWKHSKNVTKGLLGALLMAVMLSAIECLGNAVSIVDKVCEPIVLLAATGLFVSHFYINSVHHSKPGMIRLNQYLWLILAIAWPIKVLVWACASGGALSVIMAIAVAFGRIFVAASVVCVESRLDAYRLDREAAGWTEEKGYPEGYVHEYEKK